MRAWTRETQRIWEQLALGGVRVEKRYVGANGRRVTGEYAKVTWYVQMPDVNYVTGPYSSKTAAVTNAAKMMGLHT